MDNWCLQFARVPAAGPNGPNILNLNAKPAAAKAPKIISGSGCRSRSRAAAQRSSEIKESGGRHQAAEDRDAVQQDWWAWVWAPGGGPKGPSSQARGLPCRRGFLDDLTFDADTYLSGRLILLQTWIYR